IDEGPPVVVEEVAVSLGGTALAPAERERLLGALPIARGAVFGEDAYERAVAYLRAYYRERGFARVRVRKRARVDVRQGPGGLARLRLAGRRAPARLHRARVLPPPLDRRRLPPAPLPRRAPACATGRLRGPGGRGDLHQRPHAPHAAPRVRATARAHGLRLLPPRVRLALGREPGGRAPAPRPAAPLRPPLRRGPRPRLELDRRSPRPDARLGDERQRRAG